MNIQKILDRVEEDEDVLCLQFYSEKAVAVMWYDYARERHIANIRFGSGRHHTIDLPDREQAEQAMNEEFEFRDAQIVSTEGAEEVDVEYG